MNYGLITKTDAETIERTLDLVIEQFDNVLIMTTEIGIDRGHTSRAINKYLTDRNVINFHAAIDNEKDRKVEVPFIGCYLIIGNSLHVADQLSVGQHLIFLDGCHSLFHTTADFLLYKDKVRVGGFFAFHDTSPHIPDFKDYQGSGDKLNPYNFIRCREAIERLGLLNNSFPGWKMIFDEYDDESETGGIFVAQRIK